ncbi:MAG: right-handed parallel beta-helix repeat-containing protein [Vicinamibacterales bacterium]
MACGDVLSEPGQYVLPQNLSCGGQGIKITASRVHLNMSGYALGPGIGPAILIQSALGCGEEGPTDVHINNGTITGYNNAAISLCNADSNHINAMVLTDRVTGVQLNQGSDDNDINGNYVSGNKYGLLILNGSNRNRFNTNVCNSNVDPFNVNGHSGCVFVTGAEIASSNNVISSNEMTGNGLFGVEIGRGIGNTIRGNTITETLRSNIGTGVRLVTLAQNNIVRSNTTTNNRLGITLQDGSGNLVQSNTAQFNTNFDLKETTPASGQTPCTVNTWKSNTFDTANEPCIK